MDKAKRAIEWTLGISVVAAALFGGADLTEPHIRNIFPNIPESWFNITLVLALLFTTLSILFAFSWILVVLADKFMERPRVIYEIHPSSLLHDVSAIYTMASSEITRNISQESKIKSCIEQNSSSYFTIR